MLEQVFPAGGAVLEGYGTFRSGSLLEEVSHWVHAAPWLQAQCHHLWGGELCTDSLVSIRAQTWNPGDLVGGDCQPNQAACQASQTPRPPTCESSPLCPLSFGPGSESARGSPLCPQLFCDIQKHLGCSRVRTCCPWPLRGPGTPELALQLCPAVCDAWVSEPDSGSSLGTPETALFPHSQSGISWLPTVQ